MTAYCAAIVSKLI